MATSTTSVTLPESIVRAAEIQARLGGVSLQDWLSRVVAERLDTAEGANEYFRRRSAGAEPGALGRALAAVPDLPPDSGDGFDE